MGNIGHWGLRHIKLIFSYGGGGGGGADQEFSWTGTEAAVKCYTFTDNQDLMERRQTE